jgi:hypothetical protein
MNALLFALALLIQAPPQEEADKAAADLLKKIEERVMKAKTLHVEFEAVPEGREDRLKGELKIGENGAFFLNCKVNNTGRANEEMTLRSDGRTVSVTAPRVRVDVSKWSPAAVQKCLRRVSVEANFLGIYLLFTKDGNPDSAFEDFTPKDVKSEGKEKVGAVEANLISFNLALKEGPRAQNVAFKLWVDPVKLTILRRQINMDSQTVLETTSRFDLDAPFPVDAFEYQTSAMLLEGRTAQLAASVALYARYTGRAPRSLDDLTKRPADLPAAVFWPETGFWIGGAIPRDIPYSTDSAQITVGSIREPLPPYSPVGAPTERLKKFFEARVRIQLLKAAGEAYRKATSSFPKDPQDLVKKSDAARFFPEGGWIGGSLPNDPWGDPFTIRCGGTFSISIAKPKGRLLKIAEVTPDERKALDLIARPPLAEKDAAEIAGLIKQLGGEKLSEREAATKAILAKGGGALQLVTDALAGEKDPEVASRLGLIRDQFRSVKSAWEGEFKGYRSFAAGGDSMGIAGNERVGSLTLKTLTTAQADFRSNDRDGNRTIDFYVRDVAGLYALKGATGTETEATAGKEGEQNVIIRLVEPSVAKADATEDRWEYPVLGIQDVEPKAGYVFAALKHYEQGGKPVAYHDGSGRNSDQFGFVAFPAEYGVSGTHTFIVNEDNTIWQKDLKGEEIDTFPSNPAAEGWRKLD